MTFNDALSCIKKNDNFSQKPSLERIKKVLDALENPQKKYKVIHLVGTNGKGSITSMTANILQKTGLTVGKYISPFVYNFGERISVNNINITPEELAKYVKKVKNITDSLENIVLSEFEFITVVAFLYFNDKNCDIVCLEAGLGGEFDATNVIDSPLISVVTKISLDHTKILGNNLSDISKTKCKVIKKSTCVSYPCQDSEVLEVLNQYNVILPDISTLSIISCDVLGSKINYQGENYNISLVGNHQIYNAITVIEICKQLKNISYENIFSGLNDTNFSGRMEILSKKPLIIFDGAHNLDGILALEQNINTFLKDKKITLVMAMMADKECKKSVETISKYCKDTIFTTVDLERCKCPDRLASFSTSCGKKYSFTSAEDAFLCAVNKENDMILVCGSLYLGQRLKAFLNKDLKPTSHN